MNKVKEVFIRSRRLATLRFLLEGPSYELNASVLQSALHIAGFRPTRDVVLNEALWLEEQGLVMVEKAAEDLPITLIKLTERGMAVARGEITAEGVDRPLPR